MKKLIATLAAAVMASGMAAAAADAYPTKAIDMIIPYGAGGTTDIYARKLASLLEVELGQKIVPNNIKGASGSIGSQTVRDAASDGYTLLVCAETMGTYRTMDVADLGYDDFTVITPLVGDPKVIVVSKDSEYETMADLLDAIKANPGEMTMSHSGPGGSGHNQGLVLGQFGYDVAMISYGSGNDALMAVLSGDVDFTNPNISTLGGYIDEDGDLRALAVFSDTRMEAYPDIPAFTETLPECADYVNIPYTVLSLCVNNDTPADVVEVIRDAVAKVMVNPEWTDFVAVNAAEPLYAEYTTDEEIKGFYDHWQSVVCWMQYDNHVAPKSPDQFGIARP